MRPAIFAFALLLLSGCSGGSTSTTSSPAATATGHELLEHFDGVGHTGEVPAGWVASSSSTWAIEGNATAPSGSNVVRGHGTAPRNWLLAPAGTFGDVDLRVKVNVLDRTEPGGAGVVLRYVDDTHYTLIRYSPAEAGWHLFVADGGDPSKKGDATWDPSHLPALGQWTDLHVTVEGTEIHAYQGSELVIDYEAPSAVVGQVGLFTRGATTALFDDFEADA